MLKKIYIETHIDMRFLWESQFKEFSQEFILDSDGNVSLKALIWGGDLENGSRDIKKHIDANTAASLLNDVLDYFEKDEPTMEVMDGDTYYLTMFFDDGKESKIYGSSSCPSGRLVSLCNKIRNAVGIDNLYLFDTYSFEDHEEPDLSEMDLDE